MTATYDLSTFLTQLERLTSEAQMSVLERALLCSEVEETEKYKLYKILIRLYASELYDDSCKDSVIVEEAIESLIGESETSVDFVVISQMIEEKVGSIPDRGRKWLLRASLLSNRLFQRQKSDLINIYASHCGGKGDWISELAKVTSDIHTQSPDTVERLLSGLNLTDECQQSFVSELFTSSSDRNLKRILSKVFPNKIKPLLPTLQYDDIQLLVSYMYFGSQYKAISLERFLCNNFFSNYELESSELELVLKEVLTDLFSMCDPPTDGILLKRLSTDEKVCDVIRLRILFTSSIEAQHCVSMIDSYHIPLLHKLKTLVYAMEKWDDCDFKTIISHVCKTDRELELSLSLQFSGRQIRRAFFFNVAALPSRYILASHDCNFFRKIALLFLFCITDCLPRDVACIVLEYLLTLERPKIDVSLELGQTVLFSLSKRKKQISDINNHHKSSDTTLFTHGSWE